MQITDDTKLLPVVESKMLQLNCEQSTQLSLEITLAHL